MGDITYPLTTSYSLEAVTLELPVLKNGDELAKRPEMSLKKYPSTIFRNLITKNNQKTGVSLIPVMRELCIYHSIDSVTNSGYIQIEDQNNLITTFPIIGYERIHIKFKVSPKENTTETSSTAVTSGTSGTNTTPAKPVTATTTTETTQKTVSSSDDFNTYDRYFYVYSIDNFEEMPNGVKYYTINFTSLASILDANMRLEIRYEDKSAEEILDGISKMKGFNRNDIKYICPSDENANFDFPMLSATEKSEVMKNGTSMPIRVKDKSSKQKHDIICPSWRPLNVINRVVNNSCSDTSFEHTDSGYADCVFYQQIDGMYELSSYYAICNSNNVKTVKYMPWVNDTNQKIPMTQTRYSIKNYKLDELYNKFEEARRGTTGNITNVLDFALGKSFKYVCYYNSYNIKDSEVAGQKVSPSYLEVEPIKSNAEIATLYDVNINYHGNNLHKLNSKEENNNVLMGLKQSPEAKVNVVITGMDETSFQGISSGSMPESAKLQRNMKVYATSPACCNIMKLNQVVFELNPCLGLRLGDKINIDMTQTKFGDVKETDNSYVKTAFINGIWWIGDIKYVLTVNEIKTFVTAYRNNMVLF